ncbi:signal peptidase II [Bacteroidales bacterium]|nr:signal peptidase II [Bacteroidales bacterium]
MKTKNIALVIALLIVLDQSIKLIINAFFFEINFEIITSFLEFKPKYNTKHSYFNVLISENTHIEFGLWFHVMFFILLQGFMLLLYNYVRTKIVSKTTMLDLAFSFQISALICALTGSLIWKNGTLDFIHLKPLFIFDLKDAYIIFFTILFLYR